MTDKRSIRALHVSGLPEDVKEEDLQSLFSDSGNVIGVSIPYGINTKRYAFVFMDSMESCELAVHNHNNTTYRSNNLLVSHSRSRVAASLERRFHKLDDGGEPSSMSNGHHDDRFHHYRNDSPPRRRELSRGPPEDFHRYDEYRWRDSDIRRRGMYPDDVRNMRRRYRDYSPSPPPRRYREDSLPRYRRVRDYSPPRRSIYSRRSPPMPSYADDFHKSTVSNPNL